MINEFIEKTIKFLDSSDIKIHMPVHQSIKFNGNSKHVGISINLTLWETKLQDNLIFHIMIFFSLLDAYVDDNFPELEGISFKKKYNSLPESNDDEIIIREVFRVFKILRNAVAHSKNAILIKDNDIICINYPYRGTTFVLEFTKLCLELIYTVVLFQLKETDYLPIYKTGLLRSFYDEIKGNILEIKDDCGHSGLKDISDGLRIKRLVRYNAMNPSIQIDQVNKRVVIEKLEGRLSDEEALCRSFDFLIPYEGETYLVPEEALSAAGIITFDEMLKWKVR